MSLDWYDFRVSLTEYLWKISSDVKVGQVTRIENCLRDAIDYRNIPPTNYAPASLAHLAQHILEKPVFFLGQNNLGKKSLNTLESWAKAFLKRIPPSKCPVPGPPPRSPKWQEDMQDGMFAAYNA